MSAGTWDAVGEWEKTLATVAVSLRKEFHLQFPFKEDGEVSPDILALRDAFYAFPVATDVLLIDASTVQAVPQPRIFLDTDRDKGPIWTLITHHLETASGKEVTFHGTRSLADLDDYFPLLGERFGLDDEHYRDSIRNLTFTGCWTLDASEIVEFVPFDIRERPTDYAEYLAKELLMSKAEALIGRFRKEIDFNAVYGLKPDRVLTLEELTKIDPTTALFVKLEDGQAPTIEVRQANIGHIQLIPKVPDDVRTTFRRAKDAYIFGYFRYGFFTASVHYGFLALEAAIAARWSVSLPQKVTLSCGQKTAEMAFPSHTKILNHCRREHWNVRNTLVQDDPFPFSSKQLLNWLESQKIVTKWEKGRLEIGLAMRNLLSHVEFAPTDMPSADRLVFVAELINKLFHNVAPLTRK